MWYEIVQPEVKKCLEAVSKGIIVTNLATCGRLSRRNEGEARGGGCAEVVIECTTIASDGEGVGGAHVHQRDRRSAPATINPGWSQGVCCGVKSPDVRLHSFRDASSSRERVRLSDGRRSGGGLCA